MHDATHTKSSDQLFWHLRRVISRAALPYLAFGVSCIVAVFLVGREIEHHINAIDAWITQLGPWGPKIVYGWAPANFSAAVAEREKNG